MNQMKLTLGTLSVLLTLVAGLESSSRAAEGSVAEEVASVPQPCRDLHQKRPKVWPTLQAQSRNKQYRLIQVNWDVEEVLDGDWLGVFSKDPKSISSEDLKFIPQTTPRLDLTTPTDDGGTTFSTLEAVPRNADVARKFDSKGSMEAQMVITDESTAGLVSLSSNSTLDNAKNDTIYEVTEQPLEVHRKVHQRNKNNFKGKRRRARNRVGRKSHHSKRKFRNRQLSENLTINNSNYSSEEYIKITHSNSTDAEGESPDKDDEELSSWKPRESSVSTAPTKHKHDKSSFLPSVSLQENERRQITEKDNNNQLVDEKLLIEHSSTIRILKSPESEEKGSGEKANSKSDYSESSGKWEPVKAALHTRVSREAEPSDEVIIITDKDEESRFGGGFSSGSKNDKSILSTSAEEEHRFGGGVGMSENTVKEKITFVTDPNEENRFGGGLGIIPDYSIEDADEINHPDIKEEQPEPVFSKQNVQTLPETQSGAAPEEVADVDRDMTTTTTKETLMTFESGPNLATVQPELSSEVSLSATDLIPPMGTEQSPIHEVNVSEISKTQSHVKGYRSKAERTGMNGDFFRGLQDNYNNEFIDDVTVNHDQVRSHSKKSQTIKGAKFGQRKKKTEKNKSGNVNSKHDIVTSSRKRSKTYAHKKSKEKKLKGTEENYGGKIEPVSEKVPLVDSSPVENYNRNDPSQIDLTLGTVNSPSKNWAVEDNFQNPGNNNIRKRSANNIRKRSAMYFDEANEEKKVDNEEKDSGKEIDSIFNKALKYNSTVPTENSNINTAHSSFDLTSGRGKSSTKTRNKNNFQNPEINTSSTKAELISETSVNLGNILKSENVEMSTFSELPSRSGRHQLKHTIAPEYTSAKDVDLNENDFNRGYGLQAHLHLDNEQRFLADDNGDVKNEHRSKKKYSLNESHGKNDKLRRSNRKKSKRSRYFGGDVYKYYDYQDDFHDYDSHYDSHKFHGSGYRSHEIHGHHKEYKAEPYVDTYDDIYDDYPEYQKYEDNYYDEYYPTGSEPAHDVVISSNKGIANSVNAALRDEGSLATATREDNTEATELPNLDDVKIGDGNFLNNVRIDSGNISKNLTSANDFILITNGTNENEISIIASDLNTESNSVVRVVTRFSDATNTSTIVMSTNDDRDPSKVVISGLEVRPSAILITGGSHSPSIVVKKARGVSDLSHSIIHFNRETGSTLHDILDYSMILRWYPVENLENFTFEVTDIDNLFRINEEFYKSLKNDMEFDSASYENRIARADKFRAILKQRPATKRTPSSSEKHSLSVHERNTQKGKKILKRGTPAHEANIDSGETNLDADFDLYDDLGEEDEEQSKESKNEDLLQTMVKSTQNSKILDYPTEDAEAPFIIERFKKIEKISPSRDETVMKNGKSKLSQMDNQEIPSSYSSHPVKRRSGAALETKPDIVRGKLLQKPKPTTASISTVSSETDQIMTPSNREEYFDEKTDPNLSLKNGALPAEKSSNDTFDYEFLNGEIRTDNPLKQESLGLSGNRTSRLNEEVGEPSVGWSQNHPWVKFSALPTSTAGKITSTVQHPRVPSSKLSEGGCVGDWVGYIRQGEVIASACIEAYPAWMWDNRDVLINRPLEDLALLGTHNAGSWKTTDFFDAVKVWIVCQDETVLDQLLYGVRHLDLRIGYYPDLPEKLWINHDTVRWAPLSDLLDDVLQFTKLSPDLVVLDIHRTPVGFEDPQATVDLLDMIQSKLGDLLYPYQTDSSNQSYSSRVHGSDWNSTRNATRGKVSKKAQVTLGDIWTAGRSVIVCWGDRGMRLNNPWLWPSIKQEWADTQLKSSLMAFMEARSRSHSNTSGFWALMAHLTPSFWDVILGTTLGIRGFTDRVAGSVDEWLDSSEWLESGSIIAVDMFHSFRMVSKLIDLNIARASCPELLHERVMSARKQRELEQRIINEQKFSIKNGRIFIENENDTNFRAQNESSATQSPAMEVEVAAAVTEEMDPEPTAPSTVKFSDTSSCN